ncbi:hypothetical protein JI664_23575 [Rhodobacter sp. NTK016B]|uniref:hypothetical protein n=1 Tax=Rhodobacter sp. NTK016B TaxID=2759676 RepID=UPI001A8EBA4C|nr:hypothetical protein [Rhodobacter sp. NTK016B]MBN8294967.1 hypothetical protein [Rhodobacter sp. NTK016B]
MIRESDLNAAVDRLIGYRQGALKVIARERQIVLTPAKERDRLQLMKIKAHAPRSCGPEIPVAPARGVTLPYAPQAVRATANGYEPQHVGFEGRDAARAADVFDTMTLQARRRGGGDPLTPAQVDTGRRYGALVERHSSVGLKCVSVEAQDRSHGSGGGSYMDAVLAEGDVIRRMTAAIGTGFALEVTRNRGGKRRSITIRALVDMVCIEGLSVTDVLKKNGWAVYGELRGRAYGALGDALDRMRRSAPALR